MTDSSIIPDTPKGRPGVETYIAPDGSAFLFDPASDTSYTLDQLGALVWDYCDGLTTVDRIMREIADLLHADVEAAPRVARLLSQFANEGLLEPANYAPRAGADDD